MSGHGWVIPNASGVKARCGGPAICPVCAIEARQTLPKQRERVLVEPGYTVEPRYVELEDGEEICTRCRGRGQETVLFGQPGHNVDGICGRCQGDGKQRRCSTCGKALVAGLLRFNVWRQTDECSCDIQAVPR